MPENISWSLSAGGPSGTGISAAGKTTSDATVSMSKVLEPDSGEKTFTLQIDQMDKVTLLAIDCDLLDGKVTIKATGEAKKLTGPILLFGEMTKLFAGDLSNLTVENKSTDTSATLSVLIGLTVTV